MLTSLRRAWISFTVNGPSRAIFSTVLAVFAFLRGRKITVSQVSQAMNSLVVQKKRSGGGCFYRGAGEEVCGGQAGPCLYLH